MKKSVLTILLAMSLILTLCAACGSSDSASDPVAVSDTFSASTPEPTAEAVEETAAPTEAAEETAAPEVTPAPEAETQTGNTETSGQSGTSAQSGNSQSGTPAEAPAQDKLSTALDMIGASVDELYAAIGQPNSSSYTESCLVLGAEDGFLEYGDFTVATIRRADGSELVYDVY